MNRIEIRKAWLAGATTGRGSNLFIEGDCIYSYGHHFIIAVRRRDGENYIWYVCNTDRYSVTTARHKSTIQPYCKPAL